MILRRLGAILLLTTVAACAGAPGDVGKQAGPAVAKPDPGAILTAADAARDDGQYADALTIYQQLLVEYPGLKAAEYGVAESMIALGKPSVAKTLFDGLIKTEKFHARALQGQGLAQLALGERKEASKTLAAATEADPKLWRCWNALGTIADSRGEHDKAQAAYEKALALKPNSAMVINNVGYSRLMAHDPPDAEKQFRKALSLDPGNETIQNNLRLAIAAKGDYREAVKFASRDKLSMVLNNVGFVAMERGDYAAAEGLFARAMDASKSYAVVTAKNLDQLKSLTGKDAYAQ